jgi:hypothetical protein
VTKEKALWLLEDCTDKEIRYSFELSIKGEYPHYLPKRIRDKLKHIEDENT